MKIVNHEEENELKAMIVIKSYFKNWKADDA